MWMFYQQKKKKVHVDVQGKASGGENHCGPKESLEQIAEQR